MELGRRDFIRRVGLGVFTVYTTGMALPKNAEAVALPNDIKRAANYDDLKGLEVSHTPMLKLPMVAEDGRVVPIEFTVDHPMRKDHYITSVTFVVLNDPIASKGMYLFTPQSGKAKFKFQARMASGTSAVYAVVECNNHGRWVGEGLIRIVGGGC